MVSFCVNFAQYRNLKTRVSYCSTLNSILALKLNIISAYVRAKTSLCFLLKCFNMTDISAVCISLDDSSLTKDSMICSFPSIVITIMTDMRPKQTRLHCLAKVEKDHQDSKGLHVHPFSQMCDAAASKEGGNPFGKKLHAFQMMKNSIGHLPSVVCRAACWMCKL